MDISSKNITGNLIFNSFLQSEFWIDTFDISLIDDKQDQFLLKYYNPRLTLEKKLEVLLFMFCFIALPSFIVFLYCYCKEPRRTWNFEQQPVVLKTDKLYYV